MPSFIADEPIVKFKAEVASLYQLSDGEWITLTDVREIKVQQGYKSTDGQHDFSPGVIVLTGSIDQPIRHRLKCETIEEAQELGNQIAADRNAG